MTSQAVNVFVVYQFLKRLVTPFRDWPAFKAGIIDQEGNILKNSTERKTQDDKAAFRTFDLMVLKFKKLLGAMPGGKSKIASYAAALWFIKEGYSGMDYKSTDELLEDFENFLLDEDNNFLGEDVPANAAAGGNVASIGQGAKGEPGVKKKHMDKISKLIKRRKKRKLGMFEDTEVE